jgi:hypothetical protein
MNSIARFDPHVDYVLQGDKVEIKITTAAVRVQVKE